MTELLAPCGSLQALEAALRCGCDAVYLGGKAFSARQNATNFSDEELKNAVYQCHKRGVKVYLAINTVVFDSQIDELQNAVKIAAEIGVDGLITQDFALTEVVKKCCPQLEIHASTQMTVHTADGMEAVKKLGFSRAVLSRELPLDVIKELSSLGLETEVFVHGALCMSVSGQCYMSGIIGSRSANRGLCAQACRLPISAVKAKHRHDLSLKDMSYFGDVEKLVDAGVTSLKIEGRMKRPEYVAEAVTCCKNAVEGKDYDVRALQAVFSRSGFTNGYLYKKTGSEMFGTRQKEDALQTAAILPQLHELYRRDEKRSPIKFKLTVKENQPSVLSAADDVGNSVCVSGDNPQTARNKEIDGEYAEKQLSKLGDTIYSFGGVETDFDHGLMLPASVLNDLRRRVCEKLDDKRAEHFTHSVSFEQSELEDFPQANCPHVPAIRVSVTKLSQLEGAEEAELCAVPLDLVCGALEKGFSKDKIMVLMPRFTFDEQAQHKTLEKIKAKGVTKLLASNIAHCIAAEKYGFELHTDFGFNITNSVALNVVKALGAKDSVLSFELKSTQINSMKKALPVGIFAYGKLPCMLTVNCPILQAEGCKGNCCERKLYDRTGREFSVKCSKELGYVEVLNAETLYLVDKLDSFHGLSFLQLCFDEETPMQVKNIISQYKNLGHANKPENITNGLYFRGVF